MRTISLLLLVLGCFGLLVLGSGGPADSLAQKKVENICDDGKDNDGDKLVDCADPDCSKDPKCDGGEACSPGYWKNHTELWFGECCEEGPDCNSILADLQARGPGSSAIRAAAADLLEECLGQPCNE